MKALKLLCLAGSILAGLSAPSLLVANNSFGPPDVRITCGVLGTPPCTEGGEIVDAIDVGEAQKWGCKGKNLYFTPHKGGQCWSCPDGYKRTLKPIHKGAGACTKRGWGKQTRSSQFVRSVYGCPAGQFHRLGRCLQCPGAGEVRGFLGMNPRGRCTTKPGCLPSLRLEEGPPKALQKLSPTFTAKCTNLPKNNTSKVLLSTFADHVKAGASLKPLAAAFLVEASLSSELRRALRSKDQAAAVRAVRRFGSFQRVEAQARKIGYQTISVGLGVDVQIVVGANQEFGVAMNLLDRSIGTYSTTGVSAGLALGVEGNLGIGFWTTSIPNMAGFGRGAAFSAGGGVSVGAASWFSYEPTIYQGTTYTAGSGVGVELGELNAVYTQVY